MALGVQRAPGRDLVYVAVRLLLVGEVDGGAAPPNALPVAQRQRVHVLDVVAPVDRDALFLQPVVVEALAHSPLQPFGIRRVGLNHALTSSLVLTKPRIPTVSLWLTVDIARHSHDRMNSMRRGRPSRRGALTPPRAST